MNKHSGDENEDLENTNDNITEETTKKEQEDQVQDKAEPEESEEMSTTTNENSNLLPPMKILINSLINVPSWSKTSNRIKYWLEHVLYLIHNDSISFTHGFYGCNGYLGTFSYANLIHSITMSQLLEQKQGNLFKYNMYHQ